MVNLQELFDQDITPKKSPCIESITTEVGESSEVENGAVVRFERSTRHVQRKLRNRHVQLISISGVIGTALFVSIGKALYHGGAANLLIGFAVWCIPIMCFTVCTAEMVCFLPISSPFLRLAHMCVDDSLGVMAGWNFWFLECVQIPYEIVSVNTIIHYWRDDYNAAIPLVVQLALYGVISLCTVRYYGEAEFWLASFKIVLAIGLYFFTFVTMLGGNPRHDRYGFRYYGEVPFKKYWPNGHGSNASGHFQGFLACVIQAAFTIAGGEYVSMLAGEVILPRKVMPKAFKQVFVRLTVLFLGSCLCVGILCSPNDLDLTAAINESRPGAGSSPYVIAMKHLHIRVLPDIVNAALITAAFSSGNAYTYCSSRTLYGLALEGYAPKIFARCTPQGTPIFAMAVSMCWGFLSLLQLNDNSAVVLNWLINLITTSQLINFVTLCVTYLFFRRVYQANKHNLPKLPFKSWWEPWPAYTGIICAASMVCIQGYTVFFPSLWSCKEFLFSYLMVFIDIGLYFGYKFIWRRGKDKLRDPAGVNLLPLLVEIDAHEYHFNYTRYVDLESSNDRSDQNARSDGESLTEAVQDKKRSGVSCVGP